MNASSLNTPPVRVLIVDDSALVRALLTDIFQKGGLTVVGAAPDPYVARELIKQHDPDVLTLDVEMPRMDGLEFLERLMHAHPMPVVMLSSLTEKGADVTMKALELGAIDFMTKPKIGISEGLRDYAEELVEKVQSAARCKVARRVSKRPPPQKAAMPERLRFSGTEKIIAVGASTGGTEAILRFLQGLPSSIPGIVIAQHMPPGFTASFAERLAKQTSLDVREANGNERIVPGSVFVAPGDYHLMVSRDGANYVTRLTQTEAVNRHRPAVDVLFDSVAQVVGSSAYGVILTGMGKDGAQGLLRMRQAGAHTIGQDEASSVVYGMPREAFEIGAVAEQLPLDDIAPALVRALAHVAVRI